MTLNALREIVLWRDCAVDMSAKQMFISQFILGMWETGREEKGAPPWEPADLAFTLSTII